RIDIAAPGDKISTLWLGGVTVPFGGTSAAAPFVSGTMALILSKYAALTNGQAVSQLKRTAVPIPATPLQDKCPAQPCNQFLGAGRIDPLAALGAIRITRSTAVGALGAAIPRTVNIFISSGNTLFYSGSVSLLGQSSGCEVRTVKDPPCVGHVEYDFGKLPSGTYRVRFQFSDPQAAFFANVELTTPNTIFSTSINPNTGTIEAGNATRAFISLNGTNARNAEFEVVKN
ncbi:MAG: S8 family serine peptidase, partial [Limisphaerales bacterium]